MQKLFKRNYFILAGLIFLCLSVIIIESRSRAITVKDNDQRIKFLKGYEVVVDNDRPYYNSRINVPESFNALWEIRNAFAKDMLGVDLSRYKGRKCDIFMYPVSKLPFQTNKDMESETRAVIITLNSNVICSYIEFISETKSVPSVSLPGKSISDITGVKWDTWKLRMEDDDNKELVIWKYYECLKSGDNERAYSYIYDKGDIKKEEFIKAARNLAVPDMELINLEQSGIVSDDECSFKANAKIENGSKSKTYEIRFNLKKDPSSFEYGGWKIVNTTYR